MFYLIYFLKKILFYLKASNTSVFFFWKLTMVYCYALVPCLLTILKSYVLEVTILHYCLIMLKSINGEFPTWTPIHLNKC